VLASAGRSFFRRSTTVPPSPRAVGDVVLGLPAFLVREPPALPLEREREALAGEGREGAQDLARQHARSAWARLLEPRDQPLDGVAARSQRAERAATLETRSFASSSESSTAFAASAEP